MTTTARALRLVVSRPSSSTTRDGLLLAAHRRLLSAASTEAGGAGDTAVHSGDAPSDDYVDLPPRFSGAEEATSGGRGGKSKLDQGHAEEEEERVAVPPFAPSGKKPVSGPHSHSHQEVADPAGGATFTQKRRLSREPREAATPGGPESAARKVREEDREYYRTHKPSPLAEVEFADTRKPLTRATDGSAAEPYADAQGRMVEDTVDESLARAEAMFRDAAARGNPKAWPHSRALAQMLARRAKEQQQHGKKPDAGSSSKPC